MPAEKLGPHFLGPERKRRPISRHSSMGLWSDTSTTTTPTFPKSPLIRATTLVLVLLSPTIGTLPARISSRRSLSHSRSSAGYAMQPTFGTEAGTTSATDCHQQPWLLAN